MIDKLWFLYPLCAAMLWGINYSCTEKILSKGISPSFLIAIESVLFFPVFICLSLWLGKAKGGFDVVVGDKSTWPLLGAIIVCSMAASYMATLSIQARNATISSLIELSYPLFIVFFTWLFFREFHLTAYSALGGVFVLAGVFLISVKG